MFKFEIGMKKISLKKFKIGEKGVSVIVLIVTILLLGNIGYIMSSLMVSSQESIPRTFASNRAFYLAQGGINYTGKYLMGVSDWNTLSGSFSRNLGTGNFTVAFSGTTATDVTATITGNDGSAHRQIIASFHKTGGKAIRSLGGINMGNNARVDCEPSNPSNPLCNNSNLGSCPCTRQYVSSMPTISPSGSVQAICGSHGNNYSATIPAGTYYCPSGISFGNNPIITLSGAVTIFTTSLDTGNSAQINASGNPANLLIITQGNVTGNNLQFKGAIYSPGYSVNIGNNAQITGTIAGGVSGIAGTINIGNNSQINLDAAAGSNSPYYAQIGGGGASTVSVTSWQQ
jgi:hypothetical protein